MLALVPKVSGPLFISGCYWGQSFLISYIWDISSASQPNVALTFSLDSPLLISMPLKAFLTNQSWMSHCARVVSKIFG
jgi:hypothetical protein